MNFERLISLVNWLVVFLKVPPIVHVENRVVVTLVVKSYMLVQWCWDFSLGPGGVVVYGRDGHISMPVRNPFCRS